MLPPISKRELNRLAIENAEAAKAAKPFIDLFCERTIDKCCRVFAAQEVDYYQVVDKGIIFMLQLQIGMARDLKNALEVAINDGEQAKSELKESGNYV